MKNITLLVAIICLSNNLLAQTTYIPTFTLANQQLVNGGTHFQFDVLMHISETGSFHARGHVYLNYNTTAFGENIAASAGFEALDLLNEQFSGADKYTVLNGGGAVDNANNVLAITWESNFIALDPNSLFHTEVPITVTPLFRLTLPIIDSGELAGVSFNTPLMESGGQYRRAVGDNILYENPIYNNNGLLTAVLPLDLLSFTAKNLNDQWLNQLNWSSINELNFAGFTIERSLDGRQFNKIGWQDGKGGELQANYQFLDSEIITGQTYYYRLQLHDIDGTYGYSPIRKVITEGKMNGALSLQPNPATNYFEIDYHSNEIEEGLFILYNTNGLEVLKQQINLTNDHNNITINTENIPSGTYSATLTTPSAKESQTIVIIR